MCPDSVIWLFWQEQVGLLYQRVQLSVEFMQLRKEKNM